MLADRLEQHRPPLPVPAVHPAQGTRVEGGKARVRERRSAEDGCHGQKGQPAPGDDRGQEGRGEGRGGRDGTEPETGGEGEEDDMPRMTARGDEGACRWR